MNRYKVLLTVGIVLVCLMAVRSSGAADVMNAGLVHFPPFLIVDDEKNVSGLTADMFRTVLEEANIDYTLQGLPKKRANTGLSDGTFQLTINSKSEDLDGKVLLGDIVVQTIELRIYAFGQTPLPKGPEDLRGSSLLTMFGYEYGGLIQFFNDPENDIKTFPLYDQQHLKALQMLQNGRAQYLAHYRGPIDMALENYELPELHFTTFFQVPVFFGVAASVPNAAEVLASIEDAFVRLRDQNVLPEIFQEQSEAQAE